MDRSARANFGEKLSYIGFLGFAFGLSFSIAFAQTSLAVTILGWFIWRSHSTEVRWQRTSLDPSLIVFLLLTIISVWSGRAEGIHRHDIAKAVGLPLILPLVATLSKLRPAWVEKSVRLFLAGVSLNAIYALALWVIDAFQRQTWYVRAHGSFSMSLTYAEITAMAIIFFAVRGNKKGELVWSRLAVPAAIVAMILTFARGTYIGFGLGLVFVVWVRFPRKAFAASVLAVVLLACWAAIPHVIDLKGQYTPIRKLLNPFGLSVLSNRYRFAMFVYGSRLIRDHPLGVGPGNVLNVFPRYIPPHLEGWKEHPSYGHLHNNFFQIAAERGLPAMVAWCWFLFCWFRYLFRRARTGGRLEGSVLAAGAVFLACGLTEYTLGDSEVAMLFWFFNGIGMKSE